MSIPTGPRPGIHKHTNPSPSHAIGAWCNGDGYGGDYPGCGRFIPLYEFLDRRQDEGPHQSYFIDKRDRTAVQMAAVELGLMEDGIGYQ